MNTTTHYVYELTNTQNGMKYIGCRTTEGTPTDDDQYYGSSTNLPTNKRDICTKTILSVWDTRMDAQVEETRLLQANHVSTNDQYYNQRATSPNWHTHGLTWDLSEHTRAKMSEAATGKPKSATTKAKMSAAHTGKTLSEAHKAKLSGANHPMANPKWQRTCPHCSVTMAKNMYTRYHGDNCKLALKDAVVAT